MSNTNFEKQPPEFTFNYFENADFPMQRTCKACSNDIQEDGTDKFCQRDKDNGVMGVMCQIQKEFDYLDSDKDFQSSDFEVSLYLYHSISIQLHTYFFTLSFNYNF